MKKISTLMTLVTLSLASCETSNKREDVIKNYSIDQIENIDEVVVSTREILEAEKMYKAIFSVRYDTATKLNRNTDKILIKSENATLIKDLDLYRNIKNNLENSLNNQGFNLTSESDNNIDVIIEHSNSKELYMPYYVNITFKKYFKGESILVTRATMRTSYEDLRDNPSVFIDKFVKVILQGKTLTNNPIEWKS